jgi:hypothetical protein
VCVTAQGAIRDAKSGTEVEEADLHQADQHAEHAAEHFDRAQLLAGDVQDQRLELLDGEAGDLLLYSFNDSDGRIGIDATQGYYPDYNISNRMLIGNMSQLQRFSILLQTGPVQKSKQYPSVLSKYYDTPGTYTISSIDN